MRKNLNTLLLLVLLLSGCTGRRADNEEKKPHAPSPGKICEAQTVGEDAGIGSGGTGYPDRLAKNMYFSFQL
ncbi:MAG: hypothetical protein P4L51_07835 [Puia sp.]|nr:hypothetical protein [Puia sp.]